jgi:predicted transcriptional regulator
MPLSPESVSDVMPTVQSMWKRWRSVAAASGDQTPPNGWYFHVQRYPFLRESEFWRVGAGYEFEAQGNPAAIASGGTESGAYGHLIGFEGWNTTRVSDDRLYSVSTRVSGNTSIEPPPSESEPPTYAELADRMAIVNDDAAFWVRPPPAYTAGAAVMAVLVGIGYFAWPFLKAGIAGGLYSRVQEPDALRHPTRKAVAEAVRAEPGVHFAELHRRLHLPRGTLSHHLGKLVETGVLHRRKAHGYVCYFPKGFGDRRFKAALASVKAAGARRILRMLDDEGEASVTDLASALDLDASTVSYHLDRLVSAGLIESRREWRTRRSQATDLGRRVRQAVDA